jgi:hypothetical protein
MALNQHSRTGRQWVFVGVWILGTIGLGWQVLQGRHAFDSQTTPPVLAALLVCTVALLWWLAGVAPDVPSHVARTRHVRLVLVLTLAVAVLFPLRTLIGPPLLFALPVLGLVVLALLRPRLHWREVTYALFLALVASIAGLGAGWVTFAPLVWASLQFALVLLGLLTGWCLLRYTGLLQAGVGCSLLVEEGLLPALTGFARGMLIAAPWAFGLVALGAANEQTWVQSWWQPLVAIQPGIAEEAWGRVLLIPLVFLIFRPVAQGRTALTVAVFVMAYWFAYLHTPGGFGALLSTAMIGTLYILPTAYLWLRQGLETAIGFHFWVDFIKFLAAYLLNHGLWLK